MTVEELIAELHRRKPTAKVTVECEHMGDGVFTHSIYADGDLVAAWDLEDE